jgi:hypothetical protein
MPDLSKKLIIAKVLITAITVVTPIENIHVFQDRDHDQFVAAKHTNRTYAGWRKRPRRYHWESLMDIRASLFLRGCAQNHEIICSLKDGDGRLSFGHGWLGLEKV